MTIWRRFTGPTVALRRRCSPARVALVLVCCVTLLLLVLCSVNAATAAAVVLRPDEAANGETAISGWLTVLWRDAPSGRKASEPLYVVTTDNGQAHYLSLGEDLRARQGLLLQLDRQRVTVRGRPATAGAGAHERVWQAAAIEGTSAPALDAALPQAVTGAKPWISILCKFSDVAAEPKPLSYFQAMLDGAYPHLKHY